MSLNVILRLNAASCILFGAIFVIWPTEVSEFLGAAPTLIVRILGMILLINGLHLVWATNRKISKLELVYFITGDLVWVILTLALVLSNIWIVTSMGTVVSLLIAAMVGSFGLLQFYNLKKL